MKRKIIAIAKASLLVLGLAAFSGCYEGGYGGYYDPPAYGYSSGYGYGPYAYSTIPRVYTYEPRVYRYEYAEHPSWHHEGEWAHHEVGSVHHERSEHHDLDDRR